MRGGADRHGCAPSGRANLRVIPSVDSVGGNGAWHDDDVSHLSLIQLDLSAKRPQSRDGIDHALCVQIVDRTGFRDDIAIPKVGGEIRNAIENALEEAVANTNG